MILKTFIKAYRQRLLAVVLALTAVLLFLTACGDDKTKDAVSEALSSVEVSVSEEQQKAGYGVFLDDAFVAATEGYEEAKEAIDDITAVLVDVYGAPNGMHVIGNSVRFVKGDYDAEAFTDGKGLMSLLGYEGHIYTFDICDVYGDTVDVKLELITTLSEYTETAIEHSTKVTYTDALPVGESVTVSEGTDGTLRQAYSVTYVNGILTEKVLENKAVAAKPNDTVVWEGTDKGASLMAVGEKLALPYDGRISSGYGHRELFGNSFHNGMDLIGLNGGCYGDEINAAANGVVVFADWHSGYGLKVIIDHGDGLSTLYAHCSKLLVSVGDTVLKGQSVALIGATGRVTGPHLHFEVLKNGAPVNPNNYIDWSTYKGSI